jgi:ABC-2 type transport system permease protein
VSAVRTVDVGHDAVPWRVVGEIARRSVILVARVPSAFIPSVLMPIFFVVAFGGAFSAITFLPGFPTTEIMNWYGPMAILQGSAFLGVMVGMSTTRDLESGFYDRLLLSPVPAWALIVGPVVGAICRAVLPFYVVLTAAALGGAKLEGNALGVLTLFAASIGTTCVHAFWTLGLAFRFKSQRAAPLMQIGVFFTIFLASAQVPIALMTGWLQDVARVNPMSNVLRLARVGFLGEVTWEDSWGGLLALGLGVALAALWARRQFARLVP